MLVVRLSGKPAPTLVDGSVLFMIILLCYVRDGPNPKSAIGEDGAQRVAPRRSRILTATDEAVGIGRHDSHDRSRNIRPVL